MMCSYHHKALFLIFFFGIYVPNVVHGLFGGEDYPSILDRFVQVVWDPSGLVRMWVGLDQLYNIILSWRTAARAIVTLPFREGRAMDDHVKIQQPRRAIGHVKKTLPTMSHLDRFAKVYSNEVRLQSPSTFVESYELPKSNSLGPFAFSPSAFRNFDDANVPWLAGSPNVLNTLMMNRDDSIIRKESQHVPTGDMFIKNMESLNALNPQKHFRRTNFDYLTPEKAEVVASFNANPQARLHLLRLMKDMGDIHRNKLDLLQNE